MDKSSLRTPALKFSSNECYRHFWLVSGVELAIASKMKPKDGRPKTDFPRYAKIAFVIFTICAVLCYFDGFVHKTSQVRAGFLCGYWHGFILPFALVTGFFVEEVSIRTFNYTDWYHVGILFGLSTIYGIIFQPKGRETPEDTYLDDTTD